MTRRVYAPLQLINKRPYGRTIRATVERRLKDVLAELHRFGITDSSEVLGRGGSALASAVANAAFGAHSGRRDAIAFFDEMLTIMPLHAFAESGSRIVQFDAALTTEFHHTDVDGMTIADLQLPWRSLYLAFDGPDGPARDGMPIDGILVTMTNPDDIESTDPFLTIRPLMTPAEPWTSSDRQSTWTLMADGRGGDDLRTELTRSADEMIEVTAGFARTGLVDMSERSRKDLDGFVRNQERFPRMLEAIINLAVNALLYLSQRPPMEERWQDGAPAKLVERAARADRQGEKASRELVYGGWSRVHHLGVPAQGGGSSVRAHWRRGHWRRQPHGPGRSLRRLVRIAPMLVGGDRGEANRQARVIAAGDTQEGTS